MTKPVLPAEVEALLKLHGLMDHVIVRRGGRPKRTARDIAVLLANTWRRKKRGDKAAAAADWIIATWESAGVAGKGIGDHAHVRAALRRANDALSEEVRCVILDDASDDPSDEPEGVVVFALPDDTAIGWMWSPGMIEAQQVNSQPMARALGCEIRRH